MKRKSKIDILMERMDENVRKLELLTSDIKFNDKKVDALIADESIENHKKNEMINVYAARCNRNIEGMAKLRIEYNEISVDVNKFCGKDLMEKLPEVDFKKLKNEDDEGDEWKNV